MFSIALVGGDGAGKTTIARMLEKSYPDPIKYLYMGINTESSNIVLPTSRLISFLKNGKKQNQKLRSLHHQPNKKSKSKSILWQIARLANRLAEEWYRQMVSYRYQRKGFIVVYDRHFLFDFTSNSLQKSKLPVIERIHRWSLNRFYPRPGLIIFLDAPAEVLYARKGEATIEYLENRRKEILQLGDNVDHFYRIDSTQSLEKVYEQVIGCVAKINNRIHKYKSANINRAEVAVNE